jgi:phospholipase/carboxylesterase
MSFGKYEAEITVTSFSGSSIADPGLVGRLSLRRGPPIAPPLAPGLHDLGIADTRDALLLVPDGIDPQRPTALMVLFHGGGGSAAKILPMMRRHALDRRFLLLLPQSVFPTWDLVIGGNGPDRETLEKALGSVTDRFAIDPNRLAFAGHSDGGSYALSLGLTNGDIVSHVIASSAGFMSVLMQTGAPRVFISHGTADEQIPIDRSGRVHAKALKDAGYDVTYKEYDGPHKYDESVVSHAVDFFLR